VGCFIYRYLRFIPIASSVFPDYSLKILKSYLPAIGAAFVIVIEGKSINMTVTLYKLELMIALLQLKLAELTNNKVSGQNILEQIVAIHIRLQLAREQAINKQIFTTV
jgi:hypothetical protein